MVSHSNPSFEGILRELNIPIINPLCHSNPMKQEKRGIKLKNLKGLKLRSDCLCTMRYQDNKFHISLSHKNKKMGDLHTNKCYY